MSAFTAEASAALDGPDWLVRRRAAAWERLEGESFPTEAEEIWRYSGIDDFDLGAFAPVDHPPPTRHAGPAEAVLARARTLADALGERGVLVVTRNGVVASIETADESTEGAVSVTSARASVRDSAELPGARPTTEILGELAPARDAFGELHDAFLADVVRVAVADKAVLAGPVVVVHVVDTEVRTSPAVACFPHTLVQLGASAEAGVIELVVGADVDPALVVPVTELAVADNAHLRYASLQVLGPGATSIGLQASRVGRDASLRSFTAGLGGAYARVRTDSDLVGQSGRTQLLAAYLGTSSQVHDFRTLQDHHAPHTESELLFKGAVADTARSVYSGLIRIRKGARGSDAFQTNHNLVLSEGAHADSVPNLDIDENDVRCSHASTVGPIDEEQRYYLETRGIEPAVAERLVVLGFFSDLARRAPFPGAGSWVDGVVARHLAGRLPAEVAEVAGDREGSDARGGAGRG
ncbi:MAG TPA: SufD family Fe-S cluster assembly protein [Acidimicrobiales bacterium]|nr:SufD family Fe-S cluster assembly protein [Acidimicrobiales bacterium]